MLKSFIFAFLYLRATFLGKRKVGKSLASLAVLRLDLIGDYIIFHNFLKYIKRSNRFRGYKLTLIGNVVWKNLALPLNKNEVNEFIWIDVNQFKNNISYFLKKVVEIKKLNFGVLLNPVFSRNLLMDLLAKNIFSSKRIAYQGDLINHRSWIKEKTDSFYDELVENPKGLFFEFYKNKFFFEQILNLKIKLNKPTIEKIPSEKIPSLQISKDLKALPDLKILPKRSAIFFIGASEAKRIWPTEYFVELAKNLSKKKFTILLLGGKKEIALASKFNELAANSPINFINLVGKVTLPNLLPILEKANLIISNDSFLPHLAISVKDSHVIVLSNGNSFSRFIPYPKPISKNYQAVFHPIIEAKLNEAKLNNFDELKDLYESGSDLDISEIKPERVIQAIEKLKI